MRKQTCNNISNYVFNRREDKQRILYSCELIILQFLPNYTNQNYILNWVYLFLRKK